MTRKMLDADEVKAAIRQLSKTDGNYGTIERCLTAIDSLAAAEAGEGPPRPPMLLATRTNGLVNTQLWMTRRGADWSCQWHGSDDCDYRSRDLLAVDRTASDEAALRLFDADVAASGR